MKWRCTNKNYWYFSDDDNDGRFHIFKENHRWIMVDYLDTDEPQIEHHCRTRIGCKLLAYKLLGMVKCNHSNIQRGARMRITVDFDTSNIEIEENGKKNIIIDSTVNERKAEILKALGLEEIPMSELREDINNLFEELGYDVKCDE